MSPLDQLKRVIKSATLPHRIQSGDEDTDNRMNEPKYNTDILDQLRFADGAPAAVLRIREDLGNVQQTLTRAADEIEKLRGQIEELKKENKRLSGEQGKVARRSCGYTRALWAQNARREAVEQNRGNLDY